MSELSQLKGIGPKREEKLAEAGIHTLRDLVYHLPRRYLDRTIFSPIETLGPDARANFCAVVMKIGEAGGAKGRRLWVEVADETGSINLVFFHGIDLWRKKFQPGQNLQIYGLVSYYKESQIVHPEVVFLKEGEEPQPHIQPLYPLTEELTLVKVEHKFLQRAALQVLSDFSFSDPFPAPVRERLGLEPEKSLLEKLHHPATIAEIAGLKAQLQRRELAPVCLRMEARRLVRPLKNRTPEAAETVKRLVSSLPFILHDGQSAALAELVQHLEKPGQFHGLLQGDVGSGKTAVAALAGAMALASGKQVAFLLPTELLAMQQFAIIRDLYAGINFCTALVTGSTPPGERTETAASLAAGTVHAVVGTHALLSPDIIFRNLDLVVVDEQHRFGVGQRQQLMAKGEGPDMLYLTATPIPRTLAQAVYGDLESVELHGKPPGRLPVKTQLVPAAKRAKMLEYLKTQVAGGARVFWVVPRILPPETTEDKVLALRIQASFLEEGQEETLRSVQAVRKELIATGAPWSVEVAHGRQTAQERERGIAGFREGRVQVLVATTIIEVGIDIPAANIMVVENPECFGLSQLHQLRGRVGRGGEQAWCFLAESPFGLPPEADERLRRFCLTHDGFEIAELDLELRGEGEVEGLAQSGFQALRYVDVIGDRDLILEVRKICREMLAGGGGISPEDLTVVAAIGAT